MNISEEIETKQREVDLLKLKVEAVRLQKTLESPPLVQECEQLRRRISRFEIDTDEDKALLKSMRIEINRLNLVKDETITSIDENGYVKHQSLLEAELDRMEAGYASFRKSYSDLQADMYRVETSLNLEVSSLGKSNSKFHDTIVELHTELQQLRDVNDRIACDGGLDLVIQDKDDRIKELETTLGFLFPVILEITELVVAWLASDKQPVGNIETLSKIAVILDKHDRVLEEKNSGTAIPESVVSAVTKMQEMLNKDLPDGVEVKVIAQPVTPKQMSEMLDIAKED